MTLLVIKWMVRKYINITEKKIFYKQTNNCLLFIFSITLHFTIQKCSDMVKSRNTHVYTVKLNTMCDSTNSSAWTKFLMQIIHIFLKFLLRVTDIHFLCIVNTGIKSTYLHCLQHFRSWQDSTDQ